MALIPGFEYDIFISYAHLDNATLTGQADGWIKQFHENLNLMLAKRFGRMGMVVTSCWRMDCRCSGRRAPPND